MPRKTDEELRIARERRKQTAFERLGTDNPRCFVCGESDWRCIEPHHLAGRKNDDLTTNTCPNCHRRLSDDQKDHPKQDEPPKDPLEAIGYFLLGLADFFAILIEKLREFGHALIDRARATPMAEAIPS